MAVTDCNPDGAKLPHQDNGNAKPTDGAGIEIVDPDIHLVYATLGPPPVDLTAPPLRSSRRQSSVVCRTGEGHTNIQDRAGVTGRDVMYHWHYAWNVSSAPVCFLLFSISGKHQASLSDHVSHLECNAMMSVLYPKS
jgi:hypothetical protein